MKRLVVVGLVLMGQILKGQTAHTERAGTERPRALRAEQLLAVRHALEQNPAFIARLALSYKRALQKELACTRSSRVQGDSGLVEAEILSSREGMRTALEGSASAEEGGREQEVVKDIKKHVEQIIAPLEQLMAAIKAQKALGGEIGTQLFAPGKIQEKIDKAAGPAHSAVIQDYLSSQSQDAAVTLQAKIVTVAQYQQFCQEVVTLCRALLQALSPQGREKYALFMGKLKEADGEVELSVELLSDLQMMQSDQDGVAKQVDLAQIQPPHRE